MLRECAVKGSFYPADEKEVREMVNGFLAGVPEPKEKSRIVIAPHAGYVCSGKTVAYAFQSLKKADCYIILSPNHTGLGEPISIYPDGSWRSPLGEVKVNEEIASRIAHKMNLERDELAHIREHSIEVLLPFLQAKFKEISIVPITIAENRLEKLKELGKVLAEIMKTEKVCIVASSDFSHYLSEERAKKEDLEAISFIEKFDEDGFYGLVNRKNRSICGYSGIVTSIVVAREIGLKRAKLLSYTSSAEITGDKSNVVGYAAISFK